MTTYTAQSRNSTTYTALARVGFDDLLLKEDGDLLLLETGDGILLEQAIAYTNSSRNSTTYTAQPIS